MYRVMIVDDEALERQGLLLILEKQFGNKIQITDVSNGKKAIEVAYHLKPEFVFMDMKMPGIDGIEAIKAIKEISPNTKFVVVSAYDSFSYAQKAIHVNVFSYLLKPVKRKDIIECMEDLMASQKLDVEKMHRELELKQQIQELVPFFEQELIQAIIYNQNDKIKSLIQMQLNDYKLKNSYCMMIEIEFNQEDKTFTERELNIYRKQIEEKIVHFFQEYSNGIVGQVSEKSLLVIVPVDTSVEFDLTREKINVKKLMMSLQAEYKVSIKMGLGQVATEFQGINKSYNEAMMALNCKKIDSSIIHISEIEIHDKKQTAYPLNDEKELCEMIHQGLIHESKVLYDRIFDWIDLEIDNMFDKRIKFLEFATVLDRSISDKVNDLNWRHESAMLIDKLLDRNDVQQLRIKLWSEIANGIQEIRLYRDENMDSIINKAKQYIHKNYVQEISLEEISQHVSVSPYYFSKLFKQKTGENFIDYLTQVRIEKAKEMLRVTDLSMKIIARRVGYKDPNYFSRVFKKVTNMKPSDFKQK